MMLTKEQCAEISKNSKPLSSDGKTFVCEWHNPPDTKIKIKKSICLVNKQDGSVTYICNNCMNSKLEFKTRVH